MKEEDIYYFWEEKEPDYKIRILQNNTDEDIYDNLKTN